MHTPKILFIAPSSYPIRNPESNVNAKVLKMLSDKGCVIDLVCRSQKKQYYPESTNDLFFSKLNSIHVVPVDSKRNFATVWNHLMSWISTGFVYRGSDWVYPAYKVCKKLLKSNRYDFIYTYNEPSEILGAVLSKKFGVRWVATWNDPYMWLKYPAPYGQGAEYRPRNPLRRKLIKRCATEPYRNIFPSERLRDYMLGYMEGMEKERCLIAPHIVTEALKSTTHHEFGETLRVVHSGSIGAERDPATFCQGLRLFLDRCPDARIHFTFLGIAERLGENYFGNLIAQYRLEEYVEQLPPVSYEESFRVVERYDAAMVLEADCAEGIFLPSKIADYIQLGKPILSLSPKVGVIADLYAAGNAIDYVAPVGDPESIARAIETMYTDFGQGTWAKAKPSITEFDEDTLYQVHCSIFDGL